MLRDFMKEYLFNQPKFHDRQAVNYKGQICLVLLVSQEADIVHRKYGYLYTIFTYLICDYYTHRDIWRTILQGEDQNWTKKDDGTSRRIPEDELGELTDEQKTQVTLTAL